MKSFSRGIFFLFCATNSVQPFKSYDHSKIKKKKKNYHAEILEAISPKYLQKLLQIAELDNGGGN